MKQEMYKSVTKRFFALFPITLESKTKWFKMIEIEGFYSIDPMTDRIYFNQQKFIN